MKSPASVQPVPYVLSFDLKCSAFASHNPNFVPVALLKSHVAEMNRATRAAISNFQSNYLYQSAALFHSTSVLEQKRRNHWRPGKRSHRLRGKQEILRKLNAYADYIFQGWKNEDDPSSGWGPSWAKKRHSKGRNDCHGRKGPQNRRRRAFEFCEDDDEVENIIRSAFGGSRFFHWSFLEDEAPEWGRSFGHSNNHRNSWNWRFCVDEEYDSSSESEEYEQISSELVADRLTLGLSASGPITIEDVKNAYRSCALKWHPDRHIGLSKAAAEEKFKLCSSAYQSLCDKLALD